MSPSTATLAAVAVAALIGTDRAHLEIVEAAPLSRSTFGLYDSAAISTENGEQLVIRLPITSEAETELIQECEALEALTPGVRDLLPFAAPVRVGSAHYRGREAGVFTHLPGQPVSSLDVSTDLKLATMMGGAIAHVHSLPPSSMIQLGRPLNTPRETRELCEATLVAAENTGQLPFGLLRRWSQAIGLDELWRFEPTVVLGGVDPESFLTDATSHGTSVTGLLQWSGLSVGDPAIDLYWTASSRAPMEALRGYVQAGRSIDSALIGRARLYGEMRYAKWLIHGHAIDSLPVVQDAVALLTSLDEQLRDADPIAIEGVTARQAIATASAAVPSNDADLDTTMMQTDAYAPEQLNAWEVPMTRSHPDNPAELDETAFATPTPENMGGTATNEPDEAARNALRRWSASN